MLLESKKKKENNKLGGINVQDKVRNQKVQPMNRKTLLLNVTILSPEESWGGRCKNTKKKKCYSVSSLVSQWGWWSEVCCGDDDTWSENWSLKWTKIDGVVTVPLLSMTQVLAPPSTRKRMNCKNQQFCVRTSGSLVSMMTAIYQIPTRLHLQTKLLKPVGIRQTQNYRWSNLIDNGNYWKTDFFCRHLSLAMVTLPVVSGLIRS